MELLTLPQLISTEIVPPTSILTLTALAFLIPLLHLITHSRRVPEVLTLLGMAFVAYINICMAKEVLANGNRIVYGFGGWPAPIGIVYEVDQLSAIFSALVTTVLFFIALYSIGYFNKGHEGRLYLYYTLLLLVEVGMLGVIYTCDIFHMFVMLEVMSIAAYILVSYELRRVALSASSKYAMFGALATTIFLLGVAYAYGCFGTVNMADIAAKVRGTEFPLSTVVGVPSLGVLILSLTILWAFTFKSAIFPNHFWLPDAHSEAPTPISALLSGLVVKVGIYGFIRIYVTVLGIDLSRAFLEVLFILGLATAFIGSLSMLFEYDVKRLIAYSTILNLGLIALGVSIATQEGLASALSYVINHAVTKALAFMSVGIAINALGSRDLRVLEGVGRVCRVVGIAFATSMIALGGIPPLNMFMAKLYLYVAILRAKGLWWALIAVAPSVIGFIGYMRAMYSVCIKPYRAGKPVKTPISSGIAVAILTAAVLVLSILTPYLMSKYLVGTASQITNYVTYIEVVRKYLTP